MGALRPLTYLVSRNVKIPTAKLIKKATTTTSQHSYLEGVLTDSELYATTSPPRFSRLPHLSPGNKGHPLLTNVPGDPVQTDGLNVLDPIHGVTKQEVAPYKESYNYTNQHHTVIISV